MKAHHRRVAQIASRYRLHVVQAKNGHLQLLDDDGRLVVTASESPKNPDHALRNIERDLRRVTGTTSKGTC